MLDWQDFDVVFHTKKDYSYDNKTIESIIKYRKEFGDQLFFDRIWKSIGLTRPSRNNYPPRSNQDLRNLWSKITQSGAPEEQKLALLYYILRDCRQIPNADSHFARKTCLPPRWQILICGLSELDHAQFTRALEYLTDPSLTPTFTDEILLTLLQHPKCEPSLATAYYIAVAPPLEDQKTLDAYFDLLRANSLVEAYYFAQKQQESRHKMLFERLVVTTHQAPPDTARAEHAAMLAGLPMTTQEEIWLNDCLVHGAASKLPGAKDTLLARRIATGKSMGDVAGTTGAKRAKIAGVDWETVSTGIAGAIPH